MKKYGLINHITLLITGSKTKNNEIFYIPSSLSYKTQFSKQ